ncbi:MAG TPA: hypothetical protein VEK08_25345 [Planctomycetota bacterium]|nr:hypothetical protein [Planctomycetota bacterium]
MAVLIVSGLLFAFLGILGGMTAFSRFVRGYTGLKLLSLPWAPVFAFGLFFSAFAFFVSVRLFDGWAVLMLASLIPFAILGSVMWCFAVVLEFFYRAAAPRGVAEPSYDVGDGLMVRRQFAEAEAAFRENLAADPLDLNALLRVSRAQLAAGKTDAAVRELESARRFAIHFSPAVKVAELMQRMADTEFRNDRILRLTFALGDIYIEKLGDEESARKLYQESLQVLSGYAPADPLRARLAALNKADHLPLADAVEKAQPRKISLED